MLIKHRIAAQIGEAVQEAQRRGLLPPVTLSEVALERPQNPSHGDYACTLPLKLARSARMSPLAIAEALAGLLPPSPEVARVQVAPPGFINFTLSNPWLQSQLEEILRQGETYAFQDIGKGLRVQIEFVSGNPTGPLHVGHGRGAVLGSTLAAILSATGYQVQREYYVNDAGSQIDAFAASLYARYLQALGQPAEMPEGGYMGEYLKDLAHQIMAEKGGQFLHGPQKQALQALRDLGLKRMLELIRTDCKDLGVEFDQWFSEQGLFQNGQYDRAIELLSQRGYLTEREGARWFTSTALGEDKDNVLVRKTGTPTYFASDIAYHYNKFVERGFQRVINIWGADHQGHVPRMKAAMAALGVNPDQLTIIIAQLVTLKRGGEIVRLSKRTGDIITLREVLDEVGADACRYFFLSRSADAQMDFDMELAKQQSQENPVYYVQYGHARIASILRLAAERGIRYADGDVSLLTTPEELDLIRKLSELPELLETMAVNLEPHHLPHYAYDLATAFHWFYERHRVLSQDEALTRARLKLVAATQIVLARALHLMGMSAPESM